VEGEGKIYNWRGLKAESTYVLQEGAACSPGPKTALLYRGYRPYKT